MPKLPKQNWSQERIRSEVDNVIADWNNQQKYETFGQFFDALLKANDNMSARELSTFVNQKTGQHYGHDIPQNLRDGTAQPTYQFISDLLSSNALNLDPRLINAESERREAGSHRVALFTKADLIEVTPHSIQQFNRDVMEGVQRQLSQGHTLHWSDIMHKLIAFHTQGDRDSVVQIQKRLNSESAPEALFPTRDSLPNILGRNAKANAAQRKALYEEVGLPQYQQDILENALEAHAVSDQVQPGNPTSFSAKLNKTLTKLNGSATLQDLQRASVDAYDGKPRILGTQFSLLRQGKGNKPTLPKMRAIVEVLEPYVEPNGPLQQSDVEELILLAGFNREEIAMTARSAIQNASESEPDIHTLLSNIRYARDVGVTLDQASKCRSAPNNICITSDQINTWETSVKTCPTREQVLELLGRYNDFIEERYRTTRKNHNPNCIVTDEEIRSIQISPEEMKKAVRISEKSRELWEQSGRDEKKSLLRDGLHWRKRISPEIPVIGNGRAL